jgi:D-amino-acid dehydrogenase
MEPGAPVIVIGAGIIGAAIAFELQRRGQAVLLIDRQQPGRGCSFGNMGSIAVTEFLPASRPSVWAKLPRWILDFNGPVALRPAYLFRLAPWLVRFILAGRRSKLREIEDAGAVLCARVHEDLKALLSEAGLLDTVSAAGCLSLYATDAELTADREHLEVLQRYGIPHEHLDRAAIEALEPAINPKIARAVLWGEIRADIAFGGVYYAIVDVDQVGMELDARNARNLAEAGIELKTASQQQIRVAHPELPGIDEISYVMFRHLH